MTETFQDCILIARTELECAFQSLQDDIRNYPTPISGCDAQFNYLLAERSKVHNALRALVTEVFVPTPRMPNAGDRVES
ncbi:hypothetical protein AB838_15920 [Rhodobacteraceae bacterium (ex Bugula neritina AB1)]|nr:hypothetical protein AB838_15920 [Rhodobacteraceae bacterium (ex Bugula neritina AB1)]